MKMQALVALHNFPYAKRRLKIGDTFQATPRDARILITLKRAQADPAGIAQEWPDVSHETPPRDLVVEAMEIPPQPVRRTLHAGRKSARTRQHA